jgi:hypothetical protein
MLIFFPKNNENQQFDLKVVETVALKAVVGARAETF